MRERYYEMHEGFFPDGVVSMGLRRRIEEAMQATPKGELSSLRPGTTVTLALKRYRESLSGKIVRCGSRRVTIDLGYDTHKLRGRNQHRRQLVIKYGDIKGVTLGPRTRFSNSRGGDSGW